MLIEKNGLVNVTKSGTFFSIVSDQSIIDRENDKLVFLSAFGYMNQVKTFINELKREKNAEIRVESNFVKINFKDYDFEERSIANSDVVQFVLKIKNPARNSGAKYFFKRKNEFFNIYKERMLNYIKSSSSVPFLDKWIDYVYDNVAMLDVEDEDIRRFKLIYSSEIKNPIVAIRVDFDDDYLEEVVSRGLKEKHICIEDGCWEESEALNSVSGLDTYLDIFKIPLAEKIHDNFLPKFDPEHDDYDSFVNDVDDFVSSKDGIEFYEAQKCTIQAIVNNLKVNNVTNVIGECGSGKSIIAATAIYAHNASNTRGFNAIVMCPSHLVYKWKREIEDRVPNSRAYVLNNVSDLIDIEKKLKNKNKTECSYVIVSKEKAKLGYEKRPAAIWSNVKKAFICPDCGKVLTKRVKDPYGRRNDYINVPLEKIDFTNEMVINDHCPHCNSKLWTAVNKDEFNCNWAKVKGVGWLYKEHILGEWDEIDNPEVYKKLKAGKRNTLKKGIKLWRNDFADNPSACKLKGSKKVSISYYIKHYLKNVFEYCILDEAHELKGKTAQGYAAYDLIKSSKKTLLLTGTLLNGYASSLFYLLYRTNSKLMKAEGFEYNDEADFSRIYGVTAKESSMIARENRLSNSRTVVKEKALPGVSPLVFTKFLLNNSVFLSLSDMEEGLPEYNEYPIGIDMDDDTSYYYQEREEILKDFVGLNVSPIKKRNVFTMLRSTIIFPDAPHCDRNIFDKDTNEMVYQAINHEEKLTNKDLALLKLVKEKLSNKEKVLIYYDSVNVTNIGSHLKKMFKKNGIYADELKSAETSASKREDWINGRLKKGLDVLICNPRLVETGLDLLDFTTVIFYQVGYNLFTLRQASRRSWRLSQTKPISVYFMYYKNTLQEQTLSLMATKLHASMAIEGKFSEEGLRALSNNDDVLTKIADNVVKGIQDTVDETMFNTSTKMVRKISNVSRVHVKNYKDLEFNLDHNGFRKAFNKISFDKNENYLKDLDKKTVELLVSL